MLRLRSRVSRVPLAPRVTVVIPCRDDAEFLDACLTALAAQEHPADRIVVIDNASTDASAEVARRHGADVFREELIGIWPAAARGCPSRSWRRSTQPCARGQQRSDSTLRVGPSRSTGPHGSEPGYRRSLAGFTSPCGCHP